MTLSIDTNHVEKMIEENPTVKELYEKLPDDKKEEFQKMAIGLQLLFDGANCLKKDDGEVK